MIDCPYIITELHPVTQAEMTYCATEVVHYPTSNDTYAVSRLPDGQIVIKLLTTPHTVTTRKKP